MCTKFTTRLAMLWLLASSGALADPFILDTFSNYLDNALISASPAGPALGLKGDWHLYPNSNFYVNRTQTDLDAGTGKAVYDYTSDDNGVREATRSTSSDHFLFSEDGDVFYASFLIQPSRAAGNMLFTLILDRLDGGGQPEVSFGIKEGQFFVGNAGIDVHAANGTPTTDEMLVVLRVVYSNVGAETVTLWVDPANELSDPVIDNVPLDFLNAGGGKVTAVSMRAEQMSGLPAFFDDLRAGLQFEDVTYDVSIPILSRDIGLNGTFYDSNNPGHGFDFNVHKYGFNAFYYGHTASGERLWLVSDMISEDLRFGVPIDLDMYEVVDGMFGHPLPPETLWGTITITLEDCDSGHASFSGLDGNLEMDLVRLSSVPGIDCDY